MANAPDLDRDFLMEILDTLASPVFVKDRAFRYVFLNQAALAVVGAKPEALVGKTDFETMPQARAEFYREKDLEVFGTSKAVRIDEEVLTDSTGSRRVLATTKVPLKDRAGEITHLVGVIQDITELKTAEEALRAANELLERRVAERTLALANAQQQLLRKERLAVLGRLVGSLAHQIRNPLGAIINAAAILGRALEKNIIDDATRAMEIIQEEGWRANRIIVDLLDYARVRPAEPQPLELATLLNRVLQSEDIPAGIVVERTVPPTLSALADRDQSEGAVRNLVRNAIEAMPTGGTLRVDAHRDGAQVVVGVSDTGPGIVAEVREQLFDPLVTTKPLGLGLGLSTARALIENQGGALTLDTSASGTRFELRLPSASSS